MCQCYSMVGSVVRGNSGALKVWDSENAFTPVCQWYM